MLLILCLPVPTNLPLSVVSDLCACAAVSISVCLYVCAICMCRCVHLCLHLCLHVPLCPSMSACMCVLSACASVSICLHVCVHVPLCLSMSACLICACVFISVCMSDLSVCPSMSDLTTQVRQLKDKLDELEAQRHTNSEALKQHTQQLHALQVDKERAHATEEALKAEKQDLHTVNLSAEEGAAERAQELIALKADNERAKVTEEALKAEIEALKAEKQELHTVYQSAEEEAAQRIKELEVLKSQVGGGQRVGELEEDLRASVEQMSTVQARCKPHHTPLLLSRHLSYSQTTVICVATFGIEHLLFGLTHILTLTITCTCCYDEIKGTQDLKIYSHADSVILSH